MTSDSNNLRNLKNPNIQRPTSTFYAHGKLLLTGEYFVLDGAEALALPTKQGQTLEIFANESAKPTLFWESFDADGTCWWRGAFDFENFDLSENLDPATGERLQQLLRAIRGQKPDFLKNAPGLHIVTRLEFSRRWGLGTSSTLIYNLAKWAEVDAFRLLADTFGGSGYDIACAGAAQATLFQKVDGVPVWKEVDFNPPFGESLFFVYLGQKQNSREGIARYREKAQNSPDLITAISQLTVRILKAKTLAEFENLLFEHEQIIAGVLQLPRAKTLHFSDFPGEVKSLGAWGGDFVLATNPFESAAELQQYFQQKGFPTVVPYREMVL